MTITTYVNGNQSRRAALLTAVLALVVIGVLAFGAVRSSAYEGIYCNPVHLSSGEFCTSSYAEHIRRAIGHSSNGGYTLVEISTNVGSKYGACGTEDCTANTGYLSADGNGYAFIEDIRSGRYEFHGYLYP